MHRPWRRPRNSLAGGRYQPQYGPPIVQALTEAWGLREHERAAWWRAFCASCWTETVALREQLLAFRPDRHDGRAFLTEVFTPAAAVASLERLVQERVLTRATAASIEERVLAQTGPEGHWRPVAPTVEGHHDG